MMIKMFFSSNFVNNHGYNHEMLTVKKCWGIITQGQPESEYRFVNLILEAKSFGPNPRINIDSVGFLDILGKLLIAPNVGHI